MTLSEKINLALAISSFILALISVGTVILALHQNNKMLESSTRPYVAVKYDVIIYPGEVARYIVVKNYGQSSAKISTIKCEGTIARDLRDRLSMLEGTSIAPGQHISYYVGDSNPGTPEHITVTCTYTTIGGKKKSYTEETPLVLVAGARVKRSQKPAAASFALQEIAEKLL